MRNSRQDLHSAETQRALLEEISHARRIGGHSFPSLFLDLDGSLWPVGVDYLNPEAVLEQVRSLLEMQGEKS